VVDACVWALGGHGPAAGLLSAAYLAIAPAAKGVRRTTEEAKKCQYWTQSFSN